MVATLPRWALAKTNRPPNLIFILTDDLGYADLSCYGAAKIKTPNIDRLAAEGVKFTDFYAAAPVCTPTRAALLTGCYPKRVGLHKGVLNNHSTTGLHPDEVTIAELLRAQGYATACIGKWHLGETPETLPTNQGFDSYFGMAGPNHGLSDLYRDTQVIEKKGEIDLDQLTQRYTTTAIEFIHKSKDKPFFLYLPHSAPHTPLYASPKFREKSAAGLYGDMIEEVDWSVGQVMATLRELKLENDTLVVFTSDNGQAGCAAPPLHGAKGGTWEAGLRVPCLVRWPGHVPAGTTCRELAVIYDWLPTLAPLVGAKLPERKIDGKNIWPLVTSPAKTPHECFVYYSRGTGKIEAKASAIRSGKWKLHVEPPEENWAGKLPPEALLATKPTEPPPWLYDLETDIGETHNVAAEHPEIVAWLRKLLEDTDTMLTREARPVFEAATKP
jgi:arylsulfatase A